MVATTATRIAGLATAVTLFAALSLFGAFAAPSTGTSRGKLLLTGATMMVPAMTEIATRFRARHPGVEIEVQGGSGERSVADARAGKADIGMVTRALDDTETELLGFTVARDGVGIMVHKDNPVQALSDSQLRDIFTGKIKNWKDVGGRDARIRVFAAPSRTGATRLFLDYFKIKYEDIPFEPPLVETFFDRIKAIVGNPEGIVYISTGVVDRLSREGSPIRLLPVDGVEPTAKNVRTRNYPISRPLTLVTKDHPTELVRDFIRFAMSPEVTSVFEKYDFVALE